MTALGNFFWRSEPYVLTANTSVTLTVQADLERVSDCRMCVVVPHFLARAPFGALILIVYAFSQRISSVSVKKPEPLSQHRLTSRSVHVGSIPARERPRYPSPLRAPQGQLDYVWALMNPPPLIAATATFALNVGLWRRARSSRHGHLLAYSIMLRLRGKST